MKKNWKKFDTGDSEKVFKNNSEIINIPYKCDFAKYLFLRNQNQKAAL